MEQENRLALAKMGGDNPGNSRNVPRSARHGTEIHKTAAGRSGEYVLLSPERGRAQTVA